MKKIKSKKTEDYAQQTPSKGGLGGPLFRRTEKGTQKRIVVFDCVGLRGGASPLGLTFYKYEGTGNDFMLIEDFEGKAPKNKEFVVSACNRHFGIGADGIIYAQKKKGKYLMRLLNPDGSEAEMCGNGIRCLAKHLFDFGFVKKKKFGIETKAGAKAVEVKVKNGKVEGVIVDMGKPEFLGSADVSGGHLFLVSMGNPHAVMFRKRINLEEVKEMGPKIESDKHFPNRTNVEFAHVKNESEIELVVWERGAGLTLACGTGACATVAAAAKEKLVGAGKPVRVKLPGGELKITLERDFSGISMEGAAIFVFKGTMNV